MPRESARSWRRWSWVDGPGSWRGSDGSPWAGGRGERRRGEAFAGGGRVADQGEDDPEVSGRQIHREGVHGARAGPAEVAARRGSEEELQAQVRDLAGEAQGARGSQES